MKNLIVRKTDQSVLLEDAIEDKEDVISLTTAFFKNVLGQVPGLNIFTGTIADYYDAKVTKKREKEIKSCLGGINKRLEGIEIKQGAVEYFEKFLVFQLEKITAKLISNPSRGFDEILAEFVANALSDLETPPETKDLILSSLLSLDSVDLLVLKTMDKHFLSNLHNDKGPQGVTRDSISTLLKDRKIDEVVINRSFQRLQSEFIIQPMKVSTSAVTEAPTSDELYKGKRPDQYDAPGGYVNTDFGRIFMKFLKLSN